MRQIRVLGVADLTYIGTNESEYSLVLEREDGVRFMMPVMASSEAMQNFLYFAYVKEEDAALQREPDIPQKFELELQAVPKQSTLSQADLDENYSPAVLDGDDGDYDEGPFGDIESI